MKKTTLLKNILLFLIPTLILVIFFCLFSHSQVSAGSRGLNDVKSVESVLIKKGDTLSSLAKTYAPVKSHISAGEYMKDIKELNNMESEHIKAGNYILLPNYR